MSTVLPSSTPRTSGTSPAPGARPSPVLAVLRLQSVKRFETWATPLVVLLLGLVFTVLLVLVVWRATGEGPGSTTLADVSRGTQVALPWLAGYLVYNGVQSVGTTFPLALSLGTTRRAFALGTLVHHGRVAAWVAVAVLALRGLEVLTGGWFAGLPLLAGTALGGGDPVRLVVTVLLVSLVAMSVGGAFAAIWLRGGARAAGAAGVVLGLLVGAAALLLVPALADLAGAFRVWWLAVAALVVVAVGAAVQVVALRGASVR
ncbi:hypothetical protein [Pseudokineococcus lusitanus]|uniref:Uncharacterized protein n=1 Tax=Pseudokineococcus lusitanus TaxID=763993 RepID=A0A3N1HT09_9ACTN|nr:hypothetical protein [Pseudokineococcus lusitanus]ROP45599.1 hypothetical protein EDC03_0203 [Pseudokineococcus lusitanus]